MKSLHKGSGVKPTNILPVVKEEEDGGATGCCVVLGEDPLGKLGPQYWDQFRALKKELGQFLGKGYVKSEVIPALGP